MNFFVFCIFLFFVRKNQKKCGFFLFFSHSLSILNRNSYDNLLLLFYYFLIYIWNIPCVYFDCFYLNILLMSVEDSFFFFFLFIFFIFFLWLSPQCFSMKENMKFNMFIIIVFSLMNLVSTRYYGSVEGLDDVEVSCLFSIFFDFYFVQILVFFFLFSDSFVFQKINNIKFTPEIDRIVFSEWKVDMWEFFLVKTLQFFSNFFLNFFLLLFLLWFLVQVKIPPSKKHWK